MNLNNQPTVDQLARLFASQKDSLDSHILWVGEAGDVHIDRLSSSAGEGEFEQCNPSMRARLKMYRRGQGYVGKKAAADEHFMGQVLQTLTREWQSLGKTAEVRVVDSYC
ncbi:hypothetical protein QN382_00630 [Pseudomonas sp. 10B1]|uniref:hypothetical protein n=1 Tax=unclassified Pseudomonas TaxID=196821 RepID=UPI002AB3A7C8|nr:MULTISPECIES: hypothetical protein [unclassified Pseudomonas]MDY7560652.1 hypothetical protein [Pseudomonas sp. AB6]MEA9976881.1 hypothetical protein [Pseudomonas sp. RTS4]MEA9993408.1 hypothetical protein [Pseudomonas sp. AA4]MEB0089063.1 hypothetical protein [Pseudomonas sp. RTI1]MEB0124105.1 hypothetical protein [Pseudomonas sp. CCC1.2]